jgi:hypothetical protein
VGQHRPGADRPRFMRTGIETRRGRGRPRGTGTCCCGGATSDAPQPRVVATCSAHRHHARSAGTRRGTCRVSGTVTASTGAVQPRPRQTTPAAMHLTCDTRGTNPAGLAAEPGSGSDMPVRATLIRRDGWEHGVADRCASVTSGECRA